MCHKCGWAPFGTNHKWIPVCQIYILAVWKDVP
jgi:hypothetical protein